MIKWPAISFTLTLLQTVTCATKLLMEKDPLNGQKLGKYELRMQLIKHYRSDRIRSVLVQNDVKHRSTTMASIK